MQSSNLHRRLRRSFLQQKCFYDDQCAPLFHSLHPNTLKWMLGPKISPLVRCQSGKVFRTMREALDTHSANFIRSTQMRSPITGSPSSLSPIITGTSYLLGKTCDDPSQEQTSNNGCADNARRRKRGGSRSKKSTPNLLENVGIPLSVSNQASNGAVHSPLVGEDTHQLLEGLKWISTAERRFSFTRHRNFMHENYKFNVGDVVYQHNLGQVGVVADRIPACFESDDWIRDQLSSTTDIRLKYPWYLILVASHNDLPVDMTRYGSELTHVRPQTKMSIGFHSLLPVYFEGYDEQKGVYIPRSDPLSFSKVELNDVSRYRHVSISSLMKSNAETSAEACS